MYRVLIVDDEDFVVDSLFELLESHTDPELDVCCAYSATEALGWLRRAKMDIIITDIQMPEMNGIALAEEVRLNWPQCKVVFLTAHAEFEYAFQAIKNNVVSYLLKTESDAAILCEVDKVIAMLDEELKHMALLEELQDSSNHFKALIRNELIIKILNDDEDNLTDLFEQLKSIGSGISMEKPFILFNGRLEEKIAESFIVERFRHIDAVQKIAAQYFGQYFHHECADYTTNRIVWIMQPKEENMAISGHEVIFAAGMLETIQQACHDTYGIRVSFAIQGTPLDAVALHECFQILDRLLISHTSDNAGFVITRQTSSTPVASEVRSETVYPDEQSMPNVIERLKYCMENNRPQEYMTELEKITSLLETCTSWHSHAALESYFSVAVFIMAYINQRKLAEKLPFRTELKSLFQPLSAISWSNAAEYLKNISEILFDLQKEDGGQISSNIIRFLREYINEHIADDISLVRLSEVSGYNASYLSRTFSENTNETLRDYISHQKVNFIKNLMKDESLNISEIATRAGFEYRTYFNKFVKKATGMSPQELRQYQLHKGK